MSPPFKPQPPASAFKAGKRSAGPLPVGKGPGGTPLSSKIFPPPRGDGALGSPPQPRLMPPLRIRGRTVARAREAWWRSPPGRQGPPPRGPPAPSCNVWTRKGGPTSFKLGKTHLPCNPRGSAGRIPLAPLHNRFCKLTPTPPFPQPPALPVEQGETAWFPVTSARCPPERGPPSKVVSAAWPSPRSRRGPRHQAGP